MPDESKKSQSDESKESEAEKSAKSSAAMDSLCELRRLRGQRKGVITRYHGKIARLAAEKATPEVVRDTLNQSKKIFDELERYHDEITSCLDPEGAKYLEEEEWFNTAERSYLELIKQAMDYLDSDKPQSSLRPTAAPFEPSPKVETPVQTPQDDETEAMRQFLGAIRLPAAEIAPFDGDVRKFHSFLAAFDARIRSQVTSDMDLLYYLDQHLRGRPKELISCYFHLPAHQGYTQARARLEKEYGDAYRISMAYLQELDDAQPVTNEDVDSLCAYSLLLLKCECAMVSYSDLSVLNHPHTMQRIVRKLPMYLVNKWRDHACNIRQSKSQTPSFSDLVRFVQSAADSASDPVYGRAMYQKRDESEPPPQPRVLRKQNHVSLGTCVDGEKSCLICHLQHELTECQRFIAMSIDERKFLLREHNLCFACLKTGHRAQGCLNKMKCAKCGRMHPTLLHLDNFRPPREAMREQGPNSTQQTVECSATSTTGTIVLHSIVPVRVRQDESEKEIITYAFLDNGSNGCFLTQELKEQLEAQGDETTLQLRTMNGTNVVQSCIVPKLHVSSLDGSNSVTIPKAYTRDIIPVGHEHIPRRHLFERSSQLRDVCSLLPEYLPDVSIGLLIGGNCPRALEPLEVVRADGDGPFGVRYLHGWTVFGPLNVKSDDSGIMSANLLSFHETEQCKEILSPFSLMKSLEHDFENPERFPGEKGWSQEDRRFMEMAEQGMRLDGSHLTIPLPFRREDALEMPQNRIMAEKRAIFQRKKMLKDESYRRDYVDFVEKVIEKGYASKVSGSDFVAKGKWYLPHHGVYNVNKGKLRVVFDCSASFQGTSLNDQLLQGPDLTNSLVGVLLRFREHSVAFTGDVESMFYQVRVPEAQRCYLRFLWWPDGDLNVALVEYEMNVHLFGAVSSPSIANFALRSIALYDPTCPQSVSGTILQNFYVDDCLKSVETESEAEDLILNLQNACLSRGFHLNKFVCNRLQVMKAIPKEDHSNEVKKRDLDRDGLPVERALGIHWNLETDCFGFNVEVKEKPSTRRGILSSISSIYDPLGFVAPFVLPAKAVLQDLCRKQGQNWDKEIPESNLRRWNAWTKQLPLLKQLKVPRCLQFSTDSMELHVFADASNTGYGAVVYLRSVDPEGQCNVSFVIGKSRLSPMKPVTVPRLELTAAVTAVKLGEMAKRELSVENLPICYYTDSTIVRHYISNDERRWPVFVANRVSVIREYSSCEQWYHVPSDLNPADEASRGLSASDLLCGSMWLTGPLFLQQPRDTWPTSSGSASAEAPLEANVMMSTATDTSQPADHLDRIISHFSDWNKVRFAIAVYMKMRDILQQRVAKKRNPQLDSRNTIHGISLSDLEEAENVIFRWLHRTWFPEEIEYLSDPAKHRVSSSSSLISLDPKVEDGILKVGGRMSKSHFSLSVKHPIILPKKSHVTSLLIRRTHVALGHAGRNHVLAAIRQRFWVVKGNSAVRREISTCVTCRRLRRSTETQKMADLPPCRVDDSHPPFYHTGIDYFGPFEVRDRRSNVKRYGVIFTCMSSRAVHIEVACTLDGDSCINAIRRFIARRGPVRFMYSDNGTNFVAANRELTASKMGFEWKFIPPTASHMGGTWERMVGTVKKVLMGILSEHGSRLDAESLSTYLCEVENIVNSRPITTVSSDSTDAEPLTPNHILTGKGYVVTVDPSSFQGDVYMRKRWRRVQQLASDFWSRWRKEFIPTLQMRTKWTKKSMNLSQGDVVLLQEDNVSRSDWPLGIVVDTETDSHGLVRTVQLRSKGKLLRRPIHNCVLLIRKDDN